jgi:Tol biopolymer transport system component
LLIEREVWLYDLERGVPTRLTNDTNAWGGLTWSPDGERIVFSAQPRGISLPNMYWTSTLADEPATPIFDDDQSREPGSWTADGFIVFEHLGDIYRIDPNTPESLEQLTETPTVELGPAASPDGRWVAYTSAESGSPEVYVRRFATGARRHRVSTDGGARPTWSPDGRTIYYQDRDAILAVDVSTGPSIELGSPRVIVPSASPDFGELRQFRSYDVLPTPGSLVMLKPRQAPPPPNPVMTLNWARELAELVP